jgi:hypothetical protein
MDKLSKVAVAFAALAVIVLIGVGIGWFASRGPELEPAPRVHEDPVTPEPAPRQNPVVRQSPPPLTNRSVRTANTITSSPQQTVTAETPTWEDKLDDILASDMEDTNKVTAMFDMFPTLDADGKVEVAQHLSNLVDDDQYAPLGQLLLDPKLPTEVLDLLIADVLNRPNPIKLPMFLGVARTPDHPNREEALELLELFLDEDYGQNWAAWQLKMEEWLKENPE